MALGDGIRRNIAHVDPAERALLIDAFIQINSRFYPGHRSDIPPGGVSWWFKQDEIHSVTHVHGGPEFIPWHRQLVNGLEQLLRQIDPRLSLHYWDWTQDPRNIPNANLGGGTTGVLNLFTPDLMGYGGPVSAPIDEPWLGAGYYVPGASPSRPAGLGGNPADPPVTVFRSVSGSPALAEQDQLVREAVDFPSMRGVLEGIHNSMHGFVNMGGAHTSFRDPFVFLLHSNVDKLFAEWQNMPGHPERLDPTTIYGSESAVLDKNIDPWDGHDSIRPWSAPDNMPEIKSYNDLSIVIPPKYDTTVDLGLINGTYSIQQKSSGRFVDAHESAGVDFSAMTRPRQNDDTQNWILTSLGDDTFTIQQKSNGRFIDAHESAGVGFSVMTRPDQNNDTQKWIIKLLGEDTYTIQQKSSGRFLDAIESAGRDFAVVTNKAENNDTQRWVIKPL